MSRGVIGQLIQQVGIGPQLAGSAGQRRDDPGAKIPLEIHEGSPSPNPGECRVRIHRIVPPGQILGLTNDAGLAALDVQERAAIATTGTRHTGK